MTLLNVTNPEPITYGSCTNILQKSGWKIIIQSCSIVLETVSMTTSKTHGISVRSIKNYHVTFPEVNTGYV